MARSSSPPVASATRRGVGLARIGLAACLLTAAVGCGSVVLQPGVVGDPPLPGEQAAAGDIPSIFSSFSDWIRPNELIVKYRPGTTSARATALEARLGAVVAKQDLQGLLRLLVLPAGTDLEAVIGEYIGLPEVEYAEPNLKVVMPEPAAAATSAGLATASAVTANDPLFAVQWHLKQVGLERAWQLSGGGKPSAIVAVVDTGVAYEDYGVFSRADDLAGVRFVGGYDFANGDAHPNDDQGHGTHVTGTIAQTTGNGLGCAGIAPYVSIMPVKVLDYLGSGSSYDVAEGIRFAVTHGAKVINMSLGGPTPDRTMRDACQYAYDHNVVVCCAAGNDGGEVNYPAGYSTTLCVSATDYAKQLTGYSSHGPEVDVAAPGGDTDADLDDDGRPDGVLQQTFRDLVPLTGFDYVWLNGTSMATPHVAGAVALLLSNGLSTANNTEAVRNLFAASCEDLGTAGKDDQYGHGLLRIDRALETLGGGQPDDDPPDPWTPPDDGEETPLPDGAIVLSPGTASPWVQFGSPVSALPGEVFSPAPDNLLAWAGATQAWVPADRLSVGGGVFLSLSTPINAYLDTRYRVSPSEEVTVPLYKGWTFVGNPYDRALPWNGDAIEVRDATGSRVGSLNEAWDRYILVGYAWTWDEDAGRYVQVGDPELVPEPNVLDAVPLVRGAWIRCFQEGLTLAWTGLDLFETAGAATRGSDPRLADRHWQELIRQMRTAEPPPAPPAR